MKRTLALAALMGMSLHHGHCEIPPAFEAASITPCKPGTPQPIDEHLGMTQFTFPGGRFNAKETSIPYLLEWAYGILPAQHSDGPAWMSDERYDIVAKALGNPTDAEMKRMVQTLLADRFKMQIHRETRKMSVVALSLGKTAPKLFPPKDGEKSSMCVEPVSGPDGKITSWNVIATRFSFARLSEVFSRHLGRVIVNHTGMDGDYDFKLVMTPDQNEHNPMDASVVLAAMRDQLGLVVKSEDAAVEFYVIEHAERVAAGN